MKEKAVFKTIKVEGNELTTEAISFINNGVGLGMEVKISSYTGFMMIHLYI